MTGGEGFFHLQLLGMSGAGRFPPRTLQTEQTVKRNTHDVETVEQALRLAAWYRQRLRRSSGRSPSRRI
jgi:hypothetical protein